MLLNVILGGGMSSRLFQTIREEHGLAYAVYSGVNAYTDAGYLSVYAATSPDQVTDVIRAERRGIRQVQERAGN